MQDLPGDTSIFTKHAECGSMTGFPDALHAACGLMRKSIQDNKFCRQHNKSKQEQAAYCRHQTVATHEPSSDGGKKRGTNGKDHDPGPDVDQMAFFCILHQEAGPGRVRDAPQAVHHGSSDEKSEILCN